MKKTLLTLTLVAATAAAFAQGKVGFGNSGAAAVTLADSAHVMAADLGVAGLAVGTSGPALPSGVRLSAGLYVGTSSGSLSLALLSSASTGVNPVTINPASGGSGIPGVWSSQNLQLLNFAGNQSVFLQVKVWDSAFASYEAQVAAHPTGDDYLGNNNIFQMTLGAASIYPGETSGGGSTWAAVGNNNPIIVGVAAATPEPGTMALAGLGAAALMVFRRRNK